MLDSAVLDIAIGMVLVYFLLSLLCVTIAELFARIFALRSGTLYAAIRNLAADPVVGKELAERFFKHPLIASLTRDHAFFGGIGNGKNKPSYIPANLFAQAFLDAVAEKVKPDAEVRTANEAESAVNSVGDDQLRKLLLAVIGADSNLQQIHKDLATWYDQYMERVSGWYKRQAQTINLVIALVLVVMLNADSLALFNALSTNPQLSAAVVEVAQEYAKDPDALNVEEPIKKLMSVGKTLEGLNLPLTWVAQIEKLKTGGAEAPKSEIDGAAGKEPKKSEESMVWFWFYKVLGLLMTTLLVSLGAPFWFDLLNKLVNLRSTGQKPQMPEAPDGSPGRTSTQPRNDTKAPVVEEPSSPTIDLDILADRAIQYAENYAEISGEPLSRADQDRQARAFLDAEVQLRGWRSVTGKQVETALAAARERQRIISETSTQTG